jgi:hypothetical protein
LTIAASTAPGSRVSSSTSVAAESRARISVSETTGFAQFAESGLAASAGE